MDIQTLKRWRTLEYNKVSAASAIARLESEMTRMTVRLTDGGGGNRYADSSKLPAQLARLEELRDKHTGLILESETLIGDILDWLKVLTPEERQIIELRYREGWSWRRIEIKMNYSQMTLWRIQERALKKEPDGNQ